MKHYTIYDASGKIIRSGLCSEDVLHLQANSGELMLEIESNPLTQYINNGVLINFPPKPDYECFFNYETKSWEQDAEAEKNVVISKRGTLLFRSDWTQSPDSPLSAEKKSEWAAYRQQLRDITTQSGYPFNVIWPIQPE